MTIETSTFIADWNSALPANTDQKSEGDDHIRKIKADIQATFPGLAGRLRRIQAKSAAYTAVLNDNTSVLRTSSTWTLTLTAAATLGNGWEILVYNDGAGTITVDPNAAETINGAATLTIAANTSVWISCNGTLFLATGVPTNSVNIATTDTAQTLTNKTVNLSSNTLTGTTAQFNTANSDADFYVTGGTDVALADGGTGASTAAGARTNLGLGTLAVENGSWATFTPTVTLVGGSGNTVPVYTTNLGRQCKVGQTQFVHVRLTGDGGAEGAGTGQINIALPNAASNSGLADGVVAGRLVNGASVFIAGGSIIQNGSTISLFDATTGTALTGADQNNTTRTISLMFFYEVA